MTLFYRCIMVWLKIADFILVQIYQKVPLHPILWTCTKELFCISYWIISEFCCCENEIFLTHLQYFVSNAFSSPRADITERNADLVCTDSNRNHVDGFTIESSRVVNVTMETICQRVQPVYMKYLTYSGELLLSKVFINKSTSPQPFIENNVGKWFRGRIYGAFEIRNTSKTI